jgi:hypothetical protein
MASKKKSITRKKLELLKRTQEITAIVERGQIEEQALLDSAGESRPVDEDHVADLLTTAEQEEEEQHFGSPFVKSRKASPRVKRTVKKTKRAARHMQAKARHRRKR